MPKTILTLKLSADEAQQLYFLLTDVLEEFWEDNDPQDESDIEFNNSIRRIRGSLAPYVKVIEDDDDDAALRELFMPSPPPSLDEDE